MIANVSRPSPNVLHRKKKRMYIKTPSALPVDNIAWIASTSKVASYLITYPFESLKLISMSEQKEPITPKRLYNGFMSYIPFCIFSNAITFHTFYTIKPYIFQHLNDDVICYIATSLATSILTSFYKIPYVYYLKNSVLKAPVSFKTLYEPLRYVKTFMTMLIEDVPDLCIKTIFVGSAITSNSEKILVSLLSCIVISPLEVLKSNVMCHPIKISMKPITLFIMISLTILRTLLYMEMFHLQKLVSFHMTYQT
jgi:hypothetical protein